MNHRDNVALVLNLLLFAVLLGAATIAISHNTEPQPTPKPSRAAAIMAEHDCWRSQGPEGVIPGSAVVALPGRDAAWVSADVGFGIYLDGDPGVLYGFCREARR